MDLIVYGPWQGGKAAGSVKRHNDRGWLVRFQSPYESKCFSDSVLGGEMAAGLEAMRWQRATSEARRLTRNKWRVCWLSGASWLEVLLQDGHVMRCDTGDIAHVEESTWFAHDDGGGRRYARDTVSKERFHTRLLPDFEMVDHIDRDTLNNRRSNLRDGGGRVNANNCAIRKDNTSGVVGVHYSEYDSAWVAQWSEDGKRRRKKFPGARDDGDAHRRAIAYRAQKAAALGILNGK